MSIISDGKAILDVLKKYKDPELVNNYLEMQERAINAEAAKLELKRRCEELEQALTIKGKLRFEKPFYYMDGDASPFCPRCWESDHRAIHVVFHGETGYGPHYSCPNCKFDITHPNLPLPT